MTILGIDDVVIGYGDPSFAASLTDDRYNIAIRHEPDVADELKNLLCRSDVVRTYPRKADQSPDCLTIIFFPLTERNISKAVIRCRLRTEAICRCM